MIKAFEEIFLKLGRKYQNLTALHSDCLHESGLFEFSKAFGERCFNFGLTESNMASASCGFAIRGNVPFLFGYSSFFIQKSLEQIRNDICYPNLNIKIIGLHAGFDEGPQGAGIQTFEDIGLMRTLPNMKITIPSSQNELMGILETMMHDFGPTYLRIHALQNENNDFFNGESVDFNFGKAVILKTAQNSQSDICIFACGKMVKRSLEVCKMLETEGISCTLVNMPSIKPLDENIICEEAKKSQLCVTVEEHSIIGGLGSAICEVLSQTPDIKVLCIGMNDTFGESGKIEFLERKYGLDIEGIYAKIKGFLS